MRQEMPMSHANLYRYFIALSLLLPIPVIAQTAFTTQEVNVRAGPDRAFPLVTWLRPGTHVDVIGCTSGWRWCDVVAGGGAAGSTPDISRGRFETGPR
jgi:uncharacterized protein YraI